MDGAGADGTGADGAAGAAGPGAVLDSPRSVSVKFLNAAISPSSSTMIHTS